jgi:hypothetical protein
MDDLLEDGAGNTDGSRLDMNSGVGGRKPLAASSLMSLSKGPHTFLALASNSST